MIGNTLTPEDAYRFARGDTVTTGSGLQVKPSQPLDFLVVADHAENLGLPLLLKNGDPELLATKFGRKFYDLMQSGKTYEAFMLWGMKGLAQQKDIIGDPNIMKTAWDMQLAAAEKYNDPGKFTSLIGFEWSSSGTFQSPGNLHRVVIFRDDSDKAGQVLPFSTFDSDDPEDLWDYLANYKKTTGGDVLAIPHNGNLSNGKMFSLTRMNGEPIDAEYAKNRMSWEPLIETTQIKGDSETHPLLSPNDEFADYGTWDKADIGAVQAKTKEMLPYEYTRSALQIGLQQQQILGINPFKMGQIGSTDSHTSMSTSSESNFMGKISTSEPSPERWKHYVNKSLSGQDNLSTFEYEVLASGLTAVWAKENTRKGLFDAMRAKEVYATTGTRITVRFFGGWDFTEDHIKDIDFVNIGYAKGVPMGGDLPHSNSKASPTFMVGAMKDPQSGNLDRIQIIKGWVDNNGDRHEKVYDIALSDDRVIKNGKAQGTVGNTVNLEDATWTNTIGDTEIRATWQDPDFNPDYPAVYYARILEIPTPTWQAYDEYRFNIKMTEDGIPRFHQERAYTSPIWYTPENRKSDDNELNILLK
jgi:hypothetical protein